MVPTGWQIAAARALLRWSQSDLAAAAGLHRNAVQYWEQRDELPAAEPDAVSRMRIALHKSGVRFTQQPNTPITTRIGKL